MRFIRHLNWCAGCQIGFGWFLYCVGMTGLVYAYGEITNMAKKNDEKKEIAAPPVDRAGAPIDVAQKDDPWPKPEVFDDPQTPAEWQGAVDAANVLLLLDSARAYGLVTGGPDVDVARCESILAQGKNVGYKPRKW